MVWLLVAGVMRARDRNHRADRAADIAERHGVGLHSDTRALMVSTRRRWGHFSRAMPIASSNLPPRLLAAFSDRMPGGAATRCTKVKRDRFRLVGWSWGVWDRRQRRLGGLLNFYERAASGRLKLEHCGLGKERQ